MKRNQVRTSASASSSDAWLLEGKSIPICKRQPTCTAATGLGAAAPVCAVRAVRAAAAPHRGRTVARRGSWINESATPSKPAAEICASPPGDRIAVLVSGVPPWLVTDAGRVDAMSWPKLRVCVLASATSPVASSSGFALVRNASQFRMANALLIGDAPAFMINGRVSFHGLGQADALHRSEVAVEIEVVAGPNFAQGVDPLFALRVAPFVFTRLHAEHLKLVFVPTTHQVQSEGVFADVIGRNQTASPR